MRRTLFYLVLPVLFLYSCKKDHAPAVEVKKYKVSFILNDFKQTSNSFALKTHSLASKIGSKTLATGLAASSNFLYYRAFNASTGSIADKITQDSSIVGFGQIDDYLTPGTYYLVFFGSKNPLNFTNGNFSNSVAYFPVPITNQGQWSDTFFQKDTVTVTGSDVNQTINMHRIVGQLTVKLTDALPSTASTITIGINEEYSQFYFSTAAGNSSTTVNNVSYTATIPPAGTGVAGWFSHSMYIMNDARPITVTVTCFDSGGNTLAKVVIPNVTIQHDVQTILTGGLFGSGTGLNIGLNQPWNTTTIDIPF